MFKQKNPLLNKKKTLILNTFWVPSIEKQYQLEVKALSIFFMGDFKLHKWIYVIVEALFLVTANAIILFSASIMWVNIE